MNFTPEDIIGIAVMMNNGKVPFLGLSTILPQGVENVFKHKPSFMFSRVVDGCRGKFNEMGILESYQFTNLTYTMLKSKYQISISKGDETNIEESIFLAENGSAGILKFNDDETYNMSDGMDQKTLVAEFAKKAKEGGYNVFLREHLCKPVKIGADDIEEVFNLMHI